MSGLRRGGFEVAWQNEGRNGRHEVYGWTLGLFGLHRSRRLEWTVTHLGTGYGTAWFRTRAEAADFVLAVADWDDWQRPDLLEVFERDDGYRAVFRDRLLDAMTQARRGRRARPPA